jgi:hypothetical protein
MSVFYHGLIRRDNLWRFRAKHVLGLDPRMDTGSRDENASKQNRGALLLFPSEATL